MTRDETIKILSILKAAYPNSYKNMTKDEANGTIMVWASQFADIPADVVLVTINKLISTNPFPPAICEVKKKISEMYWESWQALEDNNKNNNLSPAQAATYKNIFEIAGQMRSKYLLEPSIQELTSAGQQFLLCD